MRICACTETSSAEVGSSQTMNSASRGERAGDRDALPLTAGKFVRKFPAVVGMQADQFEQFADAGTNVGVALDQVEGADRLGDDGIDPKRGLRLA